ncbi:MAG: glycosyltransferase family 4 protein [Prochloraceae cyanobacterium]|nr:glycosyltransferase family 4 protein [Prochloraceae cyanobacterium]
MKILMISSIFPYPPSIGETQRRTFNILKYIHQNHEVHLVTQRGDDISEAQVEQLKQWTQQLTIFPRVKQSKVKEGILDKAKQLGTFIQQGTPPQVLSTYSPAMQEWIDEAVKGDRFDVITCEDSANEIYIRPQWREKVRTVVNIHSSVYRTCQNYIETKISESGLSDRFNLPLLRRYEQQYCSKFSAIVTSSTEDRKQIEKLSPDAKIIAIPNGVDLSLFPLRASNRGGQRLVFIGEMDKAPNIDAARFLCLEVFPEIKKRYPEAKLELIGSHPTPQVLELGELPNISVSDRITSLVDILHWATACVMPHRKGLGEKDSVLRVMAAGVPIVASDRALANLQVDGAGVPLRAMRANEIDEYVYAVGRLFEEPKLREKLSENGRSLVEKEYSWEKIGKRYEQVLLNKPTNPITGKQ